jgi:hypothetical protein
MTRFDILAEIVAALALLLGLALAWAIVFLKMM